MGLLFYEISNKIYVFSKHSIEMLCKQINFDISNKCIVLVTCKDGRNDGQTVFIGYLDEILEY